MLYHRWFWIYSTSKGLVRMSAYQNFYLVDPALQCLARTPINLISMNQEPKLIHSCLICMWILHIDTLSAENYPQSSESMFHEAVEAAPGPEAIESQKHCQRLGLFCRCPDAITAFVTLQAFKVRIRMGAPHRSQSPICRIASAKGVVRCYPLRGKGASINDVCKICGILDPLPTLSQLSSSLPT